MDQTVARQCVIQSWVRFQQQSYGARTALSGVQIGAAMTIPLQPSGSLLVPYKGPAHSYPTLSAVAVLHGTLTRAQQVSLQGALVLPGRSPLTQVLVALLGLGGLLGLNLWLWEQAHLDLPLAVPLLLVVLVAGFNLLIGYFRANRQRHLVQALFGEYVPPAHVALMMRESGAPSLEGQQRVMSVLFADIRNFTAISEQLPPAAVKRWLNLYLTAVTEVIFARQGTVDKYVGDMVMAFWNAPLEDPDHADHAVQTTLDMQQRLIRLREEFMAEGLPAVYLGVGVHTGTMNVGDMGSRYRRAYTVLGDAVNLGSRLEGLTKFYGVPILVSDVVRRCAPGFLFHDDSSIAIRWTTPRLDIAGLSIT